MPGCAAPRSGRVNFMALLTHVTLEYAHMGYESRYERYLVLRVDNGKVVNIIRSLGRLKPGYPEKSWRWAN